MESFMDIKAKSAPPAIKPPASPKVKDFSKSDFKASNMDFFGRLARSRTVASVERQGSAERSQMQVNESSGTGGDGGGAGGSGGSGQEGKEPKEEVHLQGDTLQLLDPKALFAKSVKEKRPSFSFEDWADQVYCLVASYVPFNVPLFYPN